MTKEIPLSRGLVAIVDDCDYEKVTRYKWYAQEARYKLCTQEGGHLWYAARRSDSMSFLMHRFILDAPAGVQVDHINGNGLDNRRGNLRLATQAQNNRNRGPYRTNTSGYKGVTWNKVTGKWQAQIRTAGKVTHIGTFATKEGAAAAYNEAAKRLHGDFAWLNPLEGER